MPEFRVYIEELSTRLLSASIIASTRAEAEAWLRAAHEDDTWSEWAESSSDCSIEVREDLTAIVGPDGIETPLTDERLALLQAVVQALPPELKATLEYPGYVSVPLSETHYAAFGTANGYWAGELVAMAAGVVAAVPLAGRPTHDTATPKYIAAAIAKAVKHLRLT